MEYNPDLKTHARTLRQCMTDAEQTLWSKLRRKQIHDVQFYRQKPLGCYIVDFCAPKAKLVIELDGSQHFEQEHAQRDAVRDSYLQGVGLRVLRFDNLQVLRELGAVLGEVARVVDERASLNQNQKTPPPQPPFCKGGGEDASTLQENWSENISSAKGESKNVPPFAKEENKNIPPFEKGGLEGIYGLSDFPETPETTEISK